MSARILVVDDDPWILRMVTASLRKRQFTVDTARDGRQALDRVRANVPACIICDVMMPVMDGWTFVKVLRQDPRTAAIPVIFLTALGKDTAKLRSLGLSEQDYLSKPFRFDDLEKRVDRALAGRGSTPASYGNQGPNPNSGVHPMPGPNPQSGLHHLPPPNHQSGLHHLPPPGPNPNSGVYPLPGYASGTNPQSGVHPLPGYPPGTNPQSGVHPLPGYPPGTNPQSGVHPMPGPYGPQQHYPGQYPQPGHYPGQYPPQYGQQYPGQYPQYPPGQYPPQPPGPPPIANPPQAGNPPPPPQPSAPNSRPRRATALNGKIEQLGLSSLLVMMEMERKQGVLTLNQPDSDETGRVFLRGGQVVAANLDGQPQLPGKDCVYRMLAWKQGSFSFSATTVDVEDSVQSSTTHLLMEGARLIDEAGRDEEGL